MKAIFFFQILLACFFSHTQQPATWTTIADRTWWSDSPGHGAQLLFFLNQNKEPCALVQHMGSGLAAMDTRQYRVQIEGDSILLSDCFRPGFDCKVALPALTFLMESRLLLRSVQGEGDFRLHYNPPTPLSRSGSPIEIERFADGSVSRELLEQ